MPPSCVSPDDSIPDIEDAEMRLNVGESRFHLSPTNHGEEMLGVVMVFLPRFDRMKRSPSH